MDDEVVPWALCIVAVRLYSYSSAVLLCLQGYGSETRCCVGGSDTVVI
jgi:hypothetical protein